MKLRNSTDIPDGEVKDIIRFVKPSGVAGFDVMLKNIDRGFAGRAYARGSGYHMTADPFVTIRLQRRELVAPHRRAAHGAYLPVTTFTRREMLVYVMAHELRHLWQAKHPKGWRVWGARGKFSERDACAYGIRKLREWRTK